MANIDINDLVSNMTSNSFEDDDVINKVEIAYYYCSSIFGSLIEITSGTVGSTVITIIDTRSDQAMAIVLLAEALLLESRKIIQSETDPSIVVRSAKDLFTEEMRNMLLIADETDEDEVSEEIMWSDDPPSESWSGNPSLTL